MIDTGLRHKVVCITGTNNPTGIGSAVARAFAAQGAAVFLHYFRQRETHSETEIYDRLGKAFYQHAQTLSPDDLVTELRENGSMIDAWECDLLEASAASALIARVEQTFRSVDVLVNNAALCEPDTFRPLVGSGSKARAVNTFPTNVISAEAHDRHFAVNTRAPALLMAEFARIHESNGKHWGRIINISSDGASGSPDEVSYWASKHALESYSRAAAHELGPYGITVNVASLGPIQTGWITPDLETIVARDTPLGRVGKPEDVADVVVFLASDQARWLTGQILYVGGGHKMSL